MQRLFTTFPNGWPGAALLLLRILCAFPLLFDGLLLMSRGGPESMAAWLGLAGLVPAILLLLGLYTPLAALLQVVVEISLTAAAASPAGLHLTRAAIGVALMGLGPGASSLDSRIYGRKRVEL